MNESSSDESLAVVANFLEEQPSLSSISMAEVPNIVTRPDSPTPDEHITVEALASMNTDSVLSMAGMLSSLRVEDSGQEIVAALNVGHSLKPPTTLEMWHWLESGHDGVEPGAWMTERSMADVQLWCNAVDRYRSSWEEGISQAHFQDSDSFHNEQQFYEYYK
ncbi:hypothetical protein C8J57DRAFT_1247928 [Mycena rebaudengoi]|nr:hypothetical protein C8J57DRAFT_1247928 [Mycena rebaudengoi]